MAKYDVVDVNMTLLNIDVQVNGSGVKDLAGNSQVGATFADKFNIDTLNPTVSSVTPNLTTIKDANVGTATFSVTVVYSEAMKAAPVPTLTFTPGVASTLTLNVGASSWTSNTTYVAKYDVADANITVLNVGIGVTLGEDAAGNVQVAYSGTNNFNIDTHHPAVTNVTPSLMIVTDASVGTATFALAILYDEAMDPLVPPTVTFPVENPATTLTLNLGASSWVGSTYVAVYNVADANATLPNVDVRVTGGKNLVGNPQTQGDFADNFSIDTLNPTVTSYSLSPDTGLSNSDQLTNNTAPVVTYVFSEPVYFVAGDVNVSRTGGAVPAYTVGGTGTNTMTLTFAGLPDDVYTVTLDGSAPGYVADAVGNALHGNQSGGGNAGDDVRTFTIDTVSPTVTSATPNITVVTDANVGSHTFEVSIVYDEAMNTNVNPLVNFAPGVPSTLTYDPTSSLWTNDRTFMSRFDVADANVAVSSVSIGAASARDAAGNLQTAYSGTNDFGIDTLNPTVTSVTANPTLLTDANVGLATFSVTVAYSEAMKTTGADPTITFTPAVASTLTFANGNWLDNTHYVAAYDVADAGVTVPNVGIGVTLGQDANGNVQVAYSGTNKFNIDTQNPTVTSVTPNPTTVADPNVGLATFSVTVVYSEAMKTTGADPTITFTPAVASTLTFASGSWLDNTHYVATYDVADAGVTVPNVGIGVTLGQDANGNVQVAYSGTNNFNIDTQNPTVTSVTPNPTTVADPNVGLATFSVTVAYSEAMKTTGAGPTITFTPAVASTLTFASGSWLDNTHYVATYDVADAGVTVPNVGIGVTLGQDANGNVQVAYNGTNNFNIDTQNPTVTSVTANPTLLTDANVGAATFSVTVAYSEAMKTTGADPTITFTPAIASTLTFASGNWLDNTHYVATYNVADANVTVPNVGIGVTLGQDAAGNVQAGYSGTNNFNIDTQNPTVAGVTANPTLLTDANVGLATFSVTVAYSEAMKTTGADPTITFTPAVASTLTFASGSWLDNTHYVATYNVADAGVTVPNVGIGVTLGQDANGNVQVAYSGTNNFNIDTQNPTVTSVTPNPTTVADPNVGLATFSVTVAYSEAMKTTGADPTITFIPAVASTLTFASGSWLDNTHYVATYNVADAGVTVPNVGIGVTLGQDANGNVQVAYNGTNNFNIDTQNPTVTGVTANPTLLTDANVGLATFSVTVAYSEAMKTTGADPTLTFTPGVASTLTFASGNWLDNTHYRATYNVADAGVTVANIGVGVTLGQDAAGNVQAGYSGTNNFNIDTQNPTVASLTANPTLLTDANVGTATFSVTVVYSEPMKTAGADPTLTFTPGVASTLTFASGNWLDNTHYVATYNVADAGVTVPNVGIGVTLGQDAAGNVQTGYSGTNNFNIDTQNPTVTSVTANPTLLTDANVGTGTFSVTVAYSEAMKTTGANPTITFTPAVASTLTFASGSWLDNTHYVATYDVADAGVTVPNVGIGVTLGQDANGNVQVAYNGTNNFSIDTENPTVTRVLPSLTTVTDANIGRRSGRRRRRGLTSGSRSASR